MNRNAQVYRLFGVALLVLLAHGPAHAQKWNGPPGGGGTVWRSGNVVVGAEPGAATATLEVSRPLSGTMDPLFSVTAPFQGAANQRFEVDGKRAYAGGARNNSAVLPADYDLAVHRSAAIGVVHMDEPIPGGYKLVVGGKILAEEVRVKLVGDWADYVFEPAYPLRSLDEVDAYIRVNRHLPDVPSAAEVDSDGVNLGRMQSTLLRKVEELTLYLIEQDKTIAALEHKLAALERGAE